MRLFRLKLAALALLTAFGLLPTFGFSAEAAPRSARSRGNDAPIESVVYLFGGVACEEERSGAPISDSCEIGWSGSGVIVDPTGLIVTNTHLVLDEDGEETWTIVGLTTDEDEAPELSFFAWPAVIDEDLDLALLVPMFWLDGEEIAEDELELEAIELPEDASGADVGDEVTVIGYPGLEEEETISVESGEIEEIYEDDDNPDLDELGWYDIGRFEGPGVSGGAVVDEDGVLIGIATGGWGFYDEDVDELVRPIEALVLLDLGQSEEAEDEDEERGSRDDEEEDDRRSDREDEDEDRGSRDDEEDEDRGNREDEEEAEDEAQDEAEDEAEDEGTSGSRSGSRGSDDRGTETEEPASETVMISGTLASSIDGAAIEGGLILLLQPGITVAQFDPNDESQIYSIGVSGVDGTFILAFPVERDVAYSLVIVAEGFAPIAGDGVVLATAGDPASKDIGVISMDPA